LIATIGCRLNKPTLSTAVFNFDCIRVLDLTATDDAERVALSTRRLARFVVIVKTPVVLIHDHVALGAEPIGRVENTGSNAEGGMEQRDVSHAVSLASPTAIPSKFPVSNDHPQHRWQHAQNLAATAE